MNEVHLNQSEELFNGIAILSEAVRSTLGPKGSTVLLESKSHTQGLTVTKDGATVAKSISLDDPIHSLSVRLMKQVSDNTDKTAGDGTTTAIVLAHEIIRNGLDALKKRSDLNKHDIVRGLYECCDRVIEYLGRKSQPVDRNSPKLLDIATISANNDKETGEIVARAFVDAGENGIVNFEKTKTFKTVVKTSEGMRLDKGFTSQAMVNSQIDQSYVAEDALVLVSTAELKGWDQFEKQAATFESIIKQKKPIIFICPVDQQIQNVLLANTHKGILNVCVVNPPDFGDRQELVMEDVAKATGATFFSARQGGMVNVSEEDFGTCKKAIVTRKDATLIRPEGIDTSERVAGLRKELETADSPQETDFIKKRISILDGFVSTILVGGNSDVEQKEKYDRIEDAVHAVESALSDGILPGAGKSLLYAAKTALNGKESKELEVANNIMVISLSKPFDQIRENAGLDSWYPEGDFEYGENLITGEKGNLIDLGVIDPFKVTRTALKNAVSVAATILSTKVIITNKKEQK